MTQQQATRQTYDGVADIDGNASNNNNRFMYLIKFLCILVAAGLIIAVAVFVRYEQAKNNVELKTNDLNIFDGNINSNVPKYVISHK